MKLSNNAIKFLMAQYRAIYKNAYFKGIASAVVLTAGLAAGAAQAADSGTSTPPVFEDLGASITDEAGWTGLKGNKKATDKLKLEVTGKTANNANVFALDLTSGAHSVKAADNAGGGASALTAKNGKIIISSSAGDASLAVSTDKDKSGATLELNEVDLQKGTITINGSGAGATASLTAKAIKIGNNDGSADSKATLGTHSSLTSTIAAGNLSEMGGITIGSDGVLMTATGSNNISDISVTAPTLNISGGLLKVYTADDKTSAMAVSVVQGALNGGKIEVGKSGSLTVNFDATTGIKDNGNDAERKFELNSGDVTIAKELKFSGAGTIYVKDAQITGAGDLKISGTGSALDISKDKLATLISGTKLTVQNTEIKLNDNVMVDVGGIEFDTTADINKIGVDSAATISAPELQVGSSLKGTNANLVTVKADNLTLGSSTYDNANALGFKDATAKNVKFESNAAAFKLQDAVTLRNVDSDKKALPGTISGSFTVSGNTKKLTIDGGIYQTGAEDTITLDKGSIEIKNSLDASESSLKILGNVKIETGDNNAGKIEVAGKKSKLDLTQATIFTSGKGKASGSISADSGAQIMITSSGLEDAITPESGSKAAVFEVKGSSLLTIVGDLALNSTELSSSTANKGIKLTAGTVDVQGSLTLSGKDISLGASASGTSIVKAQSFDIQVADSANDVATLKSGDFVVTNGLSTNSTKGFVLGEKGLLQLGDISADKVAEGAKQTYTSVGGGSITGAVDINSGSFNVLAGSWNAGKVSMTSGDFTIGQADSANVKRDSADQAITASLKAKELSVAKTKSITVNKYGTLTSENTKVSGSISVAGQLNLKTEYTPAVGSGSASYGLALGDDAIVIKEGGIAVLAGDGAFTALGIKEGKAVKASDITGAKTTHTGAFHDSGSFKDAAGATLKLDLAEGTSFDSSALDELQKRLYGSGSTVQGTIDIGAATISSINVDASTGEVKWEDLGAGVQKVMPNYKNDELKGAVLVAKEGATVAGHVGSIKVDSADDMVTASVNNKVSLNKADANGNLVSNKNGAVLGLKADKNSYVELDAAGKIGALTLNNGATVDIGAQNGSVNVMGNITGKSANLVNGGNIVVSGKADIGKLTTAEGSSLEIAKDLTVNEATLKTVVNGTLNVGGNAVFKGETDIQGNTTVGTLSVEKALTSTANSALKVTSGTFTAKGTVDAKGNIQVASGDATFTKKATLAGADNQFKTVSFKDEANFAKGVTKADKITLETASKPLNVTAGGTLVAGELSAKDASTVIKAGTFGNKDAKIPSSTGYISVGTLNLNGGSLVADPEFGTSAASVIAVKQLGTDVTNFKAGTLNGDAYALQNSIIALGTDNIAGVQNTFAQYFDAAGSLKKDDVGAIAFVADEIKVKGSVVVDSTANDDATLDSASGYAQAIKSAQYNGADLYIGDNSVLAVSAEATDKKAAVTFDKSSAGTDKAAYIKVADENTSKVVIASEGINAMTDVQLFANTEAASGVKFASGSAQKLRVETMNGLFYTTLDNTTLGSEFSLKLDAHKADMAFANISQPVRDTILTVAYGAHNPAAFEVSAEGAEPQDPQELVGELHSQFVEVTDGDGTYTHDRIALKGADGKADTTKTTEQVKTALVNAGLLDAKTGESFYSVDFYGNVYRDAESKFLAHVLSSLNGVDAETAARLADFGGVAQAALRAGNTTSDAIAARMGVGVNGTVTFAANGQGSGMWVTPVYKTADSDSFGADGVDYGTDMNLYGVAVGADVSVMENVSAGVMFNVGSGDADGQGLGSNVKNDFDYYGFGAYMGYTMGAASVVADVSWTTVDNSVEGQTGLGTLAASIDSSALSLGVTGKYAMDFGGVNVTPHAGLRFTRIDQDDYTVGNGTDVFAQYSSNSMNVFSVPVGVTVEKEYTFDAWSVKPAFDLTLTGNFGDDETSGTVDWEGISNLSTDIKSEFVDTFTYSTAIGVAAQTGNFGMGLGVNYTGASNVKEFGVNANVRYVF